MSSGTSKTRTIRAAVMMTLGLAIGTAALAPLAAAGGGEIVSPTAPPPPRVEHAPPHRDGYVWTAGHWEWTGRFYTWVSGSFVVERRNAHWVADRWEQMGTQWRYVPGHWEHIDVNGLANAVP